MCCPECCCGKLCSLEPGKLLRITALPPLEATLHRPERFRCATCGDVYTAKVPAEVGAEKYDASACAMVAALRYGYGMPMNRLAHFQKSLGVPLGSSTQWELIERSSVAGRPVFDRLLDEAAQGELFHNDDTGMEILSVMDKHKKAKETGEDPDRTGMFTTGIVAIVKGGKIPLFFTGRHHAGEDLDALARNELSDNTTTVANCKRWEKLTLFLRVPWVPLSNDLCERLLKTAIRHRNNSLFLKNGYVDPIYRR
jgi:transposase